MAHWQNNCHLLILSTTWWHTLIYRCRHHQLAAEILDSSMSVNFHTRVPESTHLYWIFQQWIYTVKHSYIQKKSYFLLLTGRDLSSLLRLMKHYNKKSGLIQFLLSWGLWVLWPQAQDCSGEYGFKTARPTPHVTA